MAMDCQGVVIKGYHTDNGILNDSEFMEDMLKKNQNIKFNGAGSSHQNVPSRHLSASCINMVLSIVTTVLVARSADPF